MQKRLLLTLALIIPAIPAEAQVYELMCLDKNSTVILREPASHDPSKVDIRKFAEEKCRSLAQCADPHSGCHVCYWLGYEGSNCLRLIEGVWVK